MRDKLDRYFGTLAEVLRRTEVTDRMAKNLPLEEGCEWLRAAAHDAHDAGN